MSSINLDSVTEALQNARVSPSGVSFAGRSLKLDTEEDAKPVVEEIDKCRELQYLNLEGNTLGVDASKAIAKALERHPEFKKALWKDMFTGRMKTEIPKALEYLGHGLVTAGARLTELDLSDNAFGPIGVQGLAALLRSSSCYALEELRLNNNGLGITGGKLLASALTDCYNKSKEEGKPLALKVFIAGRNRLENDGATALAEVFKMIGTLEEIAMPQNGIYHVGITALSQAFTHNKNLQVLNLNDNTIGPKGAEAIAGALPNLQNLKEINFGDCLLKTRGAILLANGLKATHLDLEEVVLGFNEIRKQGALQLAVAVANKTKLKSLVLDGNQFGENGRAELKQKLKELGKLNTLGSLEDDESEDSEEEEGGDTEESDTDSDQGVNITEIETESPMPEEATVSVEQFIEAPNAKNFFNKSEVDDFVAVLMKVAGLSTDKDAAVAESALKCTELLYKDLFIWSQQEDKTTIVNNSILVNLGLIKTKKYKPAWNVESCLHALDNILKKNYVPESTKLTLKIFMQREIDRHGEFLEIKKRMLSSLT
ncbi:hypothetical protein NQ315_001186 [Exocentrus adspersus]|uniref:Ran-GTPase activating protein 1 C-terminal domain-containing protein n=1 Tax=Exocentrus adspersus TaxID=1586481 RepID=A0AAV8WFV0_9CUCU|nr:hypothetical protein NQ315_001186 [Exocentrus adspersus]